MTTISAFSPDQLARVTRIVTHANCADGRACAILAGDVLPQATIEFLQHNSQAHRELEADPGILFCDFAPTRDRVDEFVAAGALIPVDCPPVVPGLQLSLDVDNPTPLARRVAGAVFVLYERSRSEPPLPPPMPQEALEAFATRLRAAESLDTVAVLADLLSQRTERRKEMETGTHHDALRFVESPTAIHCPRCRRTHADASQTVSDGGAGRFSCGHCGARFLARTADAPPRRFRAEEQEP